MFTTDFTGTYDYELSEARHSAEKILEEYQEDFITRDEFIEAVARERAHWSTVLDSECYADWNRHFTMFIAVGTGESL